MQIFTRAFRYVVLPGLLTLIFLQVKAQEIDSTRVSVADSTKAFSNSKNNVSQIKITGFVKEAFSGNPIPGANVSVEGFSAAITNDKGMYSLSVPDYKSVININAQGYQSKEIALKGRKVIEVFLNEASFQSIYDVVAMPFNKDLKVHIPYAVDAIELNDNWGRVSESPEAYLQGKMAGVKAVRRSGTPGLGANMNIRGFNSFNASNQPLYIVDGIVYDNTEYGISLTSGHYYNPLQDLDLKDIDNITVIKDAGASIYGTRGANGVVLINTLRAKEQVTKIDVATYGGFNFKPSETPVFGASDYKVYLADVLKTSGLTNNEITSKSYFNDNIAGNPDYYRYHYDTNWQNEVAKNSFNQNYYLKVTGGDNIATYGLSLGYLKNDGITRNTDLKRYQTRFNADLNLTKKVKAVANLSFTSNNQTLRDQGISNKTNPFYLSQVKAPFLATNDVDDNGAVSPNLADSDLFGVSNPTAIISNAQNLDNNYRFLGSFGLSYLISNSITLQTLVGVTFDKVREKIFVPNKGVVEDTLSKSVVFNRSGSYVSRLYALYNDSRISYVKSFNAKHHLSTNLGFRYNSNKSETDYGVGFNSATDEFVSVSSGQAALRRVGGSNGDWNWLNMYANADYNFSKKYFVSLNMAVDGSSRFGKEANEGLTLGGNQFAVLPSAGLAWLISSENFMANAKTIQNLRLRASYGLTGNYDIGNYAAKQYYVSQNFLGVQGLVRGNIGNPQLQWETVTKANLGLDVSLFNERLNLTLDVYNNDAKNLITYREVPVATGFNFVVSNDGGMKTNGLDLSINGRVINKIVKWDVGLNLSKYKNEVTQIPGGRMLNNFAGATYLTQTGMESNLFYGYKTNGVYSTSAQASAGGLTYLNVQGNPVPFQAGDVIFSDLNNDKIIDNNDRQVIGNPNPDFLGGLSNTVSWKNWSFDALMTFSSGNDIYNYQRKNLESMSGYENQTFSVTNRWRVEGQVTDVPRASFGDPSGNARFSDRWIEKGSYLRLRTATINYNFNFKDRAIKYARIYVTGNNIFTVTKYLGYDPEFSAGNGLFTQGVDVGLEPQFRTLQLGLRIGL
ncbi:MAG: SusC/RagA family TonB-linked outer membrane protein [Pelobium sp.]